MHALLLGLALFACKSGKIGGDDTGGDADGGTPDGGTGDGGTGDGGTGDGGTGDGGTGDGGTSGPTFRFEVDGSLVGRSLSFGGLVSIEDDLPAFAQALGSVPLTSAEIELSPALPVDAPLFELDPEGWPGWKAALYMPFVFQDEDGDGFLGADEVITAASSTWLGWFEAPLPPELDAAGFVEGWNALGMVADAFPIPVDPLDIGISQALDPVLLVTLAGTYDGAVPVTDLRLAVVAGAETMDGAPVEPRYADQALTEDWSVTIDGAPPPEHYADLDGSGVPMAAELLLAYLDLDGSEDLDLRHDGPLYSACLDGDLVVAFWVEPMTDLAQAWGATFSGYGTGWQLVADPDGEGRLLEAGEASALVIGESCPLE
ncbi:hypothetical protein L6R53_09670 [Myxococcota bacterium]|nr:hypothetical protein [Myxococcota bacterium]